MKTTLADIRETNIPQVLGLCADDTSGRLQTYLNEAVVRLLPRGQWRGTVIRFRICTASKCLTWPRQVESILAFAINNRPGVIRSHWYEFLGYGPGMATCANWCDGSTLIDKGFACAFDDICGEGKKIRIYCDLPADVGKKVLLQGWDQYRNWVLTNSGDTQGEEVTLAMPWVDTSTVWMPEGLTGVQKPITKGNVRLFELDTANALQKPLAIYEPDETRPEYRRSFVPGLNTTTVTTTCAGGGSPSVCTDEIDGGDAESTFDAPPVQGCAGGSTTYRTVTVLAKLKYLPVRLETDYLLIANYAALKDMCMSIKKRENNLIAEALAYEASAVAELERELSNFHGDGTQDPVQAINNSIATSFGVQSIL